MKYTIQELCNIMQDNNLHNTEFQDVLTLLPNLSKSTAKPAKDTSPMIGLNPFKSKKPNTTNNPTKDLNESLNHRITKYNK